MKNILIILILINSINLSKAQDNYHTLTEEYISNEFGLQNGSWVYFNEEQQNLTLEYSYGSTDLIQLTVTNEDFTQVTNILNEVEGGYSYDSGWGMSNQNIVEQNDVCLLIINLRKTNNVNQFGKVTLGIQATDNSVFEENIIIQLEEQWNQYLIPFQASKTYLPGELITALALAWEIQEIEVAGLNILNFGSSYTLDELPFVMHNERYAGYEANAPWRAEAAQRIEEYRKADLNISVSDVSGAQISGASVEIRMLQHEFKWGTAINLSRIADNFQQDEQYESKLLNLDGEGHRFEWVVPENSFKWPGVEEEWIAPFDEKINAINWLKANNYKIRLHTLLWPGWAASPFDIEQNANNPEYIINRSNEWFEFILKHPELENKFDDFDAINELTTNRDYEMSFIGYGSYITGREYYVEALNLINDLAPEQPKVINDFITISSQQYKGTEYNFFQNSLQEIIESGGEIDGIGFQSHINYFPTSIYEVETILNDFADKFDANLRITEYDIIDPRIDPTLAANYLNDFTTMVFSIPEVDMFMFWEIWDGGHWVENGTLFNLDWTPKPAAAVLFDNLYNKWWTEENTQTNSSGIAEFSAFKGEYEITINHDGNNLIDTVSLSNNLNLAYQVDLSSSTKNLTSNIETSIYPNPSIGKVAIECSQIITSLTLYNMNGQAIKTAIVNSNKTQFDTEDIAKGLYILEINSKGKIINHKIKIACQ